MGASRTSFEKLQRDRAKKAKAAAKRDKRLDKTPEDAESEAPEFILESVPEGQEIPADQLLKMVADLHERFENEEITFDEFEERKTELFAMISID